MDIEHVPRIRNHDPNDLRQVTLGYKVAKRKLENLTKVKDKLVSTSVIQSKLSMPKLVGAEKLPEFCDFFETFPIDNIANDDCGKEIVEFLKNPNGKADLRTKYKVLSYIVIGNELLKKTPQ